MKYPLYGLLLIFLVAGCARLEEPTVSWYLAVTRGDLEQVERHIHWQTDINSVLPPGNYALHDAAEKGRFILVELLLESGADTEVTDKQQHTPLEVAVLHGRTQLAKLLIQSGAKFNPDDILLKAANAGVEDRDIVEFLKKSGATLEVTDEQGNTPLMLAVQTDNHRLVYHLLEYGANVNTHNQAEETPLQVAQRTASPEVVDYLLRYGAVAE